MRLAVYTDYVYREVDGQVFAERAFALFLGRLSGAVDRLVVVGREAPEPDSARYAVGARVELVSLPYYRRLSDPWAVLRSTLLSLARFWRALRDVDCVWLLGPHPVAIVFAGLAAVRRKRIVLGVRQDMPAYMESRHPGRRLLRLAGNALDLAWRALARVFPVVVVGPGIAARYGKARSVLQIAVSLIDADDVVPPAVALQRSYDGEIRVISVGRLEAEKNPLLLADVLARLSENGSRWRLVVCGEGPLQAALEDRLEELGLTKRAELVGYVPFGPRLLSLYQESHAMLHVSWTEGLPQVIVEAFAAGIPVVATDVGGVAEAFGDTVRLIPAGDADAAAGALEEIVADPTLREALVRGGHDQAAARTAEIEVERVAEFLRRA